ncbi:MAG: hypothetical protein J0L84_06545 [Verrucomicrobia bacterium]|nr:hypothetical protein [Verrucomicrobiota bacterium]
MSSLSKDEFETARKILYRYYDTLVEQVAEDIIRHSEEFDKGTFGNADDVIERHHCRISRLAGVYANLRDFALSEKPKGAKPLGKNEFRCFGCDHAIGREEGKQSFSPGEDQKTNSY